MHVSMNKSRPVKENILQRFFRSQYMVWGVLVILLIAAQVIIPGFLRFKNISNLLKMSSFIGIAAIGQTLAIVAGGIDMSISNVITLANIVSAQVMLGKNENLPLAILSVLLVGTVAGAVNGFGITVLNIPPMIMTLGFGTVLQGCALIYCNGAPKGNASPVLRHIVNDVAIAGSVTWIVVIWLIISVLVLVLMKRTVFGRHLYVVGNNPKAAKFSGINAKAVIFAVYIISGIAAAVTGLVLAGYTGVAASESGADYSMNTIVAVVIGGTAITGGSGSYLGTIAGTIILTILESVLTVVNIPQSGRMIAQGLIILVMIMFYAKEKK